jgi:tetratricopeptide (TPR) repeat protein
MNLGLCSCGENPTSKKESTSSKANSSNSKIVASELQDSSSVIFEKAIQLQRDNGFFLLTRKDTLVYWESAKLISEAISIDPSNLYYYSNLAKIQFKLDQIDLAIATIDKLLDLNPKYIEALTAKGFMLEKIGNIQGAKDYYRYAIAEYDAKKEVSPWDIKNKIFLILLLEGKEEARLELQEVKGIISDSDYHYMEDQISFFNRNSFIDNGLK